MTAVSKGIWKYYAATRNNPGRNTDYSQGSLSAIASLGNLGCTEQFSSNGRNEMAMGALQGMRVAILASDGFEEAELLEPKMVLEDAGAATFIIAASEDKVEGWNDRKGRMTLPVDIPLNSAKAEDFHGLLLPGTAIDRDALRTDQDAIRFVKDFMETGKPVAASCHGPSTLLEAGAVRGRTMTSWPSLKTDLSNAGANWLDQEVVCDGNLVTSRTPDDMVAFDREMMRVFSEGRDRSTGMRRSY